jgi:hypothetical protein
LRELDGALAEPGEDKPPPKPKDLNTNLDGALTKPPEDEPPKPPPKSGFTSVFTSVRGRRPFPARIPPSLPPLFPTSTTPSDNTETTMPIGTRNFAFAHARIESDGESVRVIRSTGFTSAITHPGDADPSSCAPPDDLPKVAKVKPDDAGKLPPNTLLYRLLLPVNHQIDKKEAVVTATGANRATHEHYRMSAWAVNDRTVEVAVEIRNPDVNAEAKEVFALDVIVFRVD